MDREKQIEEMAQIIRNRLPYIGRPCSKGECISGDKNSVYDEPCWCVNKEIAEILYNAGYRKQSEVAREIIGQILSSHTPDIDGFFIMHESEIAELKKKYTEE